MNVTSLQFKKMIHIQSMNLQQGLSIHKRLIKGIFLSYVMIFRSLVDMLQTQFHGMQ